MRLAGLALSMPMLMFFPNLAQSPEPVIPITAEQTTSSYQLQPDGSRLLLKQAEGTYYRSSSGAVMDTMIPLKDGKKAGSGQSTFIDAEGNSYTLSHDKRLAKFTTRNSTNLFHVFRQVSPSSILGYETVNGLHCAVRMVLVNGKPAGKEWVSLPYGLLVKTAWTTPGGKVHVERELHNISPVEPDPNVFQIPKDDLVVP